MVSNWKKSKKTINTWAIFWYATIFEYNGLCLNPISSLVQNLGTDSYSTNTNKKSFFKKKQVFSSKLIRKFPVKIAENKIIFDNIKSQIKPNILNKFLKKVINLNDKY